MDERHDKPAAGARQWLGLAVLLLPTMLLTADLGVLWLATPDLTADLRPSGTELLWITDVYGFLTAGFLVVMGTLGDRVGRRRLLLAGAALYLLVEFLMLTAAAVRSPALLIGSRALLGVAGAAILPSTLSLISAMFTDPGQRTRAISLWSTALALGVGLGPVFGGLLLSQLWWGWVFLLGAPVMVVVLAAGRSLLPEFRDVSAGRLDMPSVLLFLLGILPVVYAIKRIAEHGWHAPVAAAGVAGVVFGWLFVRRQRRLAAPLLDLRLFADRTFSAALAILFLGMMALNSVEYLVPPFLQLVGGLSPMAGGLWLLPSAAAFLLGSQLTPPLVRRAGPARVLVAGTLVSLVGYVLAAQATARSPPPRRSRSSCSASARSACSARTWPSAPRPPRRRVRPRRRGRRRTTWAWRWASRSPAASPRPSTGTRSPPASPPGHRPGPRTPRTTPSAARSRRPRTFPRRSPAG
ncbi:MFS transporter [Actinomadura fulvescens]|uniref:Major facilitator superfamily (MFS) profile domain-containing protein n=1 Tax=Actinomadura fulvescens TaxID=46160 RepID=A0ABP6D0Z7_9ACTN